jgi:hypothetical protein
LGILVILTRYVKRNILTIYNTLHKPKIVGHKLSTIAFNKNLTGIEVYIKLFHCHTEFLCMSRWNIQESLDTHGSISLIVKFESVIHLGVTYELKELTVFFGGDAVSGARPDCLLKVQFVIVNKDWEGYEVRVSFNGLFDL